MITLGLVMDGSAIGAMACTASGWAFFSSSKSPHSRSAQRAGLDADGALALGDAIAAHVALHGLVLFLHQNGHAKRAGVHTGTRASAHVFLNVDDAVFTFSIAPVGHAAKHFGLSQ